MKARPLFFRKGADYVVRLVAAVAALLGLFQLGWILYIVIRRGLAAWNWDFFFNFFCYYI